MTGHDAAYEVIDSWFMSHGTRCAGTLYTPTGIDRPPVVILGHGFAAVRAFRLATFADRFARNGFAAYFFDYRNFGDSEGEPRHWVDPARHREDWLQAIAHVRSLPGIDPHKIALWGPSLGGGHVLQVASEAPPIAAVIAQVPHVSGVATTRALSMKTVFQATAAGLRDIARSLLTKRRHYSPVVARAGNFAAMNNAECWDGWFAMVPPDTSWENKVLSRVFLKIPFYNPIRNVHKIAVPTLLIAGRQDTVTPPAATKKAADRIRLAEFHLLDCNHFQPYVGAMFEKVVAIQVDFLNRTLN